MRCLYRVGMSGTDTNGRSLESLLTYVLDGVGAQDIQNALGVSAPTYAVSAKSQKIETSGPGNYRPSR